MEKHNMCNISPFSPPKIFANVCVFIFSFPKAQMVKHLPAMWEIWVHLLQSCPIVCDHMDCGPPDPSVHGILQARNTGMDCHFLLQGIFPTQGSSRPRSQTRVSCMLYHLRYQGSLPKMDTESCRKQTCKVWKVITMWHQCNLHANKKEPFPISPEAFSVPFWYNSIPPH